MCVEEARAGRASLVHERLHVRDAFRAQGPRTRAPRLGDRVQLFRCQLTERMDVARRVDDDLVVRERGVEVRDDPDPPPRRVGDASRAAEDERLRRRLRLVALAERAASGIVHRRARLDHVPRARSPRPARSDDDEAAAQGVAAELGAIVVRRGDVASGLVRAADARPRRERGEGAHFKSERNDSLRNALMSSKCAPICGFVGVSHLRR